MGLAVLAFGIPEQRLGRRDAIKFLSDSLCKLSQNMAENMAEIYLDRL